MELNALLAQPVALPSLPRTVALLMSELAHEEPSLRRLNQLFGTDPALAAQVVSWAASPYYASPGKIRSVEDAIVRVLGFDLVINLALGLALGKTLSLPKDKPQHATPYWQQAIYTAFRTDLYALGFAPAMVKRSLYLQDSSVGASRQPALLPNPEQDAKIADILRRFGLSVQSH